MVEEIHEGLVVVGVHDGHPGVCSSQPLECSLKVIVVVDRERVEVLEAVVGVVSGGVRGGEHGEVARRASDGEVPGNNQLSCTEVDHLLAMNQPHTSTIAVLQ